MERMIEYLKHEMEAVKNYMCNGNITDYAEYRSLRSSYHTLSSVLEKAEELNGKDFDIEEDD